MKYKVLINILIMLLARKTVTAKEIADRFEISKRTVYRYIDELSFAGVPVYVTRGPYGGFHIADSYKLPNLFFTEAELNTLTSLLNSLKDQLGDATELNALFDKLSASKKDEKTINITTSSFIIDGTGWTSDKTFSKKLAVVTKAVENCELLNISYRDSTGEQTVRDIEPHVMALKNGVWYVYAYCRLRQDFRLFKISRIEYATANGKFEKRPVDFKAKPIAEWAENNVFEDLVFEVSPKAKAEVEEWLGIDNVYVSRGKIFAQATLPYNDVLISEVMRFGKNVKVISPQKLKNDVASCAKQITEMYK